MPTYVKIKCCQCGKSVKRYVGYVNRAKKDGLKMFCGKKCFGLSRRDGKTKEQKKAEKAKYDKEFRYYHREEIKQRKAAAFKKDYAANPEKYRKERRRRYKDHLKYIQTPEYKKWKKEYDVKYLAKKDFGIYWESAILLKELEDHLLKIRPDGIKFQMGITNKTQKRKRLWQRNKKQKV